MKAQLIYIVSVISSRINKKKKSYFKHVMLNENLWSVQKHINTIINFPFQPVDAVLDTKQILNKQLLSILSIYGRPYFLKRNKFKSGVHTVLIYRKRIFGTRSRIVYHFIDNQIIQLQIRLRPTNPDHAVLVSEKIADLFQLKSLVSGESVELLDKQQTLLEIQHYLDFNIAMYPHPENTLQLINKII